MASYTFGLAANRDIARKLGIDAEGIDGTSAPLRSSDVSAALAHGCAAAINAAAARGVTANADLLTSHPDTHQKLRDLAQAHAVSKLARDHGRLPQIEQAWYQRAMELQAVLAADPGQYGTGAEGITSKLTSTMDNPTSGDAYEIGGVDWTGDKVF